jgi:ABC-type transport system involved in multi-copper enzyme maturation permease subunit
VTRDVWIGTFHSICAKLLRRYSEEVGLKRNFVIYDDSDQKAVLTRAVRELNLSDQEYPAKLMSSLISREKREGTLGLLFLTPLTVSDVIAGKAVIHVLRAVTLFLATVPIVGLPVVFGGVGWTLVAIAIFNAATAMGLGIAAGIYASTKGGTTVQTMIVAECYSLFFAIGSSVWVLPVNETVSAALVWVVPSVLIGLCCTGGAVIAILQLSARRLRETWQQQAAAPERPEWVEEFSRSEDMQTVFAWNKGRTLDRNPIAWLQEYSWTARLTKWGWLLAVFVAELVVMSGWDPRHTPESRLFLPAGLALAVAFSAVGSFRREHETGLLELLLVTPISVRQLLRGRVWGICCHYFPAVSVFLVLAWGDHALNARAYPVSDWVWMFFFGLLSTIVVGLYLSLGRFNFFLAWLLAWALAFVVPAVAAGLMSDDGLARGTAVALALGFQVAIGLFAWGLLERKVRLRTFVTRKEEKLAL